MMIKQRRPDLAMLDKRERYVYEARRLAEFPVTLATLAKELGVSRQLVHKLEKRAAAKLSRPTPEDIRHALSSAELRAINAAIEVLRHQPLSWENWLTVAEALLVVRRAIQHMVASGSTRRLFRACLRAFGLDLDASTIQRLFVVADNLRSIVEWRSTLSPAERLTMNHPQVIIAGWKNWLAQQQQGESK
jgi:DNA-binding XRE family transcriptional regulator